MRFWTMWLTGEHLFQQLPPTYMPLPPVKSSEKTDRKAYLRIFSVGSVRLNSGCFSEQELVGGWVLFVPRCAGCVHQPLLLWLPAAVSMSAAPAL